MQLQHILVSVKTQAQVISELTRQAWTSSKNYAEAEATPGEFTLQCTLRLLEFPYKS